MEAIIMNVEIADNTGKLIPRGIVEDLFIQIIHEYAFFRFRDAKTTKRFALLAIELDKKVSGSSNTAWDESSLIAITKYPGLTKEMIRDKLTGQFEKMGGRVK